MDYQSLLREFCTDVWGRARLAYVFPRNAIERVEFGTIFLKKLEHLFKMAPTAPLWTFAPKTLRLTSSGRKPTIDPPSRFKTPKHLLLVPSKGHGLGLLYL